MTYPLTVADLHNKSIIDPSDYSLGASGPKTFEMQITTGFSLEGPKGPKITTGFLLGGPKKGGVCPLQPSSASKSENEHENLHGQNSSGNLQRETEIIQT